MRGQVQTGDTMSVTNYFENKKRKTVRRAVTAVFAAAVVGIIAAVLTNSRLRWIMQTHRDIGIFPGQELAAELDTKGSSDHSREEFDEALAVMEAYSKEELNSYLLSAEYLSYGEDGYFYDGSSMVFKSMVYPNGELRGYPQIEDAAYPQLYSMHFVLQRDESDISWEVVSCGNG